MSDLGTCLVTGAGGLLGTHLVLALAARGHPVRGLDVRFPDPWPARWGDAALPGDAPDAGEEPRVTRVVADVRNREAVARAMDGVDTVFHTAAVIDASTRAPEAARARSFGVNVAGTRNVVDEARRGTPTRLVHTSSISVVVDRAPRSGVDETAGYALLRPMDLYTDTKIEGEKLALAADGPDLATCALRPGGVYGPGDRHHLPRVVREVLSGRLVARIGPGAARADNVFVDDLVDAHLRAADRLFPGSPVAGRVYQIGDGHPMSYYDFFRPLIEALGGRVPRLALPCWLGGALAGVAERVYAAGGPAPMVTRMEVRKLCMDNFSSIDRARAELGWEPTVAPAEGMRRCLPYALAEAARHPPVERPPWGWWVGILGGLGLLFVLSYSGAAYEGWRATIGPMFSRGVLLVIAWVAIALHVAEAAWVARAGTRAGLATTPAWTLQTLLLGYPSTRRFLRVLSGPRTSAAGG